VVVLAMMLVLVGVSGGGGVGNDVGVGVGDGVGNGVVFFIASVCPDCFNGLSSFLLDSGFRVVG